MEPIWRPGSQPQVSIDGRAVASSLSSSCRARIEAEGLSGGREMFSTVVVASLCRSVGSMTRRGGSFGRPGSQPQVIDGRSGKSLSSSCRARIEAKGLSGGIGTLMFTVVVASLRRSVEFVGCMCRRGGTFGRPGSQPQVIDGCVCLLLQYLIQSCARGGRRIVEDMCYEIRRAEACVD